VSLSRFVDRISSSAAVARRFAQDLRPQRVQMGFAIGASLLASAIELLRPLPLKWIVDQALLPKGAPHHSVSFVIWTGALAYLAISLLRGGVDYFATMRIATAAKNLTRALRLRLFRQLLSLSPSFHAQSKTGDLIVRLMGDVSIVVSMLVESSVELLSRSFLIVGTVAMLFWLDPVLSLGVLGLGPLVLVLVGYVSRRIRIAVHKARKKEGELADTMYESVNAVALIQSLGRVEHSVRRFSRSNRSNARAEFTTARLAARLGLSVELMLGIAIAIGLLWGSQRVLAGHLSAGDLLAFVAYVRSLVKPVRQTSRNSGRFAKGAACGERILHVLDTPIGIASPPDAKPAPAQPTRLTFEDVHFVYSTEEGAREALSGFSAEFRRGELVGICGQSGAGKSTLSGLALRLFDPELGSVKLDGVDLREMDLDGLRARFGLCPQDTVLFGETVRENLLLGDPESSEDSLWIALREAAAEGFVRALPQGLDTPLGSAGAGLSGGERRRLALARTLLRRPAILILDEPFSGLDREAVLAVQESLVRMARSTIVILISHDREQLALADRVVFIDRGRAAAVGPHSVLLRENLRYRAVLECGAEVSA
jgi:ATP-binding cassette, subfamily B, bacterial